MSYSSILRKIKIYHSVLDLVVVRMRHSTATMVTFIMNMKVVGARAAGVLVLVLVMMQVMVFVFVMV